MELRKVISPAVTEANAPGEGAFRVGRDEQTKELYREGSPWKWVLAEMYFQWWDHIEGGKDAESDVFDFWWAETKDQGNLYISSCGRESGSRTAGELQSAM